MNKEILVHLGPHKTGSTAIQTALSENSSILKDHSVNFFHDAKTHNAAIALAREDFDAAEQELNEISRSISSLKEKFVILSQEDFSGELIGRSRRRQIYPKLTKNMRILSRALRPHRVRFVFFKRPEEDWLRSCYHQHLKYRTRFSEFSDFEAFYGVNFSWKEKLQKPQETFGESLIEIPYEASPSAGIERLLSAIGAGVSAAKLQEPAIVRNISPNTSMLALLERVNALSEFKETAWFAKSLIMADKTPDTATFSGESFKSWPPNIPHTSPCALPALQKRVKNRIDHHSVDDILPDEDVDLYKLAIEYLPKEAELPDLPRSDMKNQYKILEYHLRGKSKLAHLNALTISYLRRDSQYTNKARVLFHRIWRELGVLLINELSTRWLISTLQTFLDHGANESQRKVGVAGYFYGNLMKIYEGERAIEGLEQDGTYEQPDPQTKSKFRGLDRYQVGNSDLLLNTNALALEISLEDPTAGIVLQEVLLRVKSSGNVFTRHDMTRKEMGIDVPGFEDTWSFFEEI
ncbi:MAG: hypothetical protein QNK19_03835 [Xanthomonadales bacterium]|nr:hypothetical protein [Xanthomonadales bacterium]